MTKSSKLWAASCKNKSNLLVWITGCMWSNRDLFRRTVLQKCGRDINDTGLAIIQYIDGVLDTGDKASATQSACLLLKANIKSKNQHMTLNSNQTASQQRYKKNYLSQKIFSLIAGVVDVGDNIYFRIYLQIFIQIRHRGYLPVKKPRRWKSCVRLPLKWGQSYVLGHAFHFIVDESAPWRSGVYKLRDACVPWAVTTWYSTDKRCMGQQTFH